VIALAVAPERHAPMREVDAIEVEAGAGIVGDRWHGTRHRHVTVQSLDALRDTERELGHGFLVTATRRNVTVDGPVPTAPGERVLLGDVLLEVVRVAAPCRIMEDTLGPGGAAALRRRGGSVFRALSGGVVRVGDGYRPLMTEQQPESDQMDQAEEHGTNHYSDPSVTELDAEPKDDL
jgi:MOSC domain-containing protein YiiM